MSALGLTGQSRGGFLGKMGEPPVSSAITGSDQTGETRSLSPSDAPRSVGGENSWGFEVSRAERPSEGAETRGSLSRRVVPIETRETSSREPGNREGGGRVVEVSLATLGGPVPIERGSTRRGRLGRVAQRHPPEPLTSLNQHPDLNWMQEAYGGARGRCAVSRRADGRRIGRASAGKSPESACASPKRSRPSVPGQARGWTKE